MIVCYSSASCPHAPSVGSSKRVANCLHTNLHPIQMLNACDSCGIVCSSTIYLAVPTDASWCKSGVFRSNYDNRYPCFLVFIQRDMYVIMHASGVYNRMQFTVHNVFLIGIDGMSFKCTERLVIGDSTIIIVFF